MQFSNWKLLYENIKKDLNLDFSRDDIAGSRLNTLLAHNSQYVDIQYCEPMIQEKTVYIIGTGPDLDEALSLFFPLPVSSTCIAADGATSALIKKGIIPDIIVSDLDGYLPDLLSCNEKGSFLLIHAHGDNIPLLDQVVPMCTGPICGTMQSNPIRYPFVSNLGGFTDGDRAVFLSDHFHAKQINLVGFDYSGKIGQYSFTTPSKKMMKQKKLQWCKYLIEQLNNDDITYL